MYTRILFVSLVVCFLIDCAKSNDVLGCGGFVKSHASIDFSKIEIKLYNKQGILKDSTFCAPTNGYYFIPLYDKGEYRLIVHPPAGWSFQPRVVELHIDGTTDICSKGGDIDFVFQGFGITGKVNNLGNTPGPAGVQITLIHDDTQTQTLTTPGGQFFFTPVYPGKYTLIASHPRWKFKKNTVDVVVTTGNTELPNNSLLVSGYDVNGTVSFENKPLSKIYFILYNQNPDQEIFFEGCDVHNIISYTNPEKMLCHVISNEEGVFTFPSLSPGQYKVVPFYEEENVKYHMEPSQIFFSVTSDSVQLQPEFNVTTFTVKCHVFTNVDGKSVPGALVILDGKQVATTKDDGSFLLEHLTPGSYKLQIDAAGLKFDPETLQLTSPAVVKSEFYPSAFQVCGNVANENSHEIIFKNTEVKDKVYTTMTDLGSGDFCYFLPPGKYSATVKVSSKEKIKGIQFFPLEQSFSLNDLPQMGLYFSQLKTTVSGKVRFLRSQDGAKVKIVLKMLQDHHDDEVKYTTNIAKIDGTYEILDVIPGKYEVSLESNKYCWEIEKHLITLTSEKTIVPDFVQKGYVITFKATHDTEIQIEQIRQPSTIKPQVLQLTPGTNSICVLKAGVYQFTPNSCHEFDSGLLTYDTDTNIGDVVLIPKKHLNTVDIKTNVALKDMMVDIKIGDTVTKQGPLKYMMVDNVYYYKVKVHLAEKEAAFITPLTESLWFKPTTFTLIGESDCVNLGAKITGNLGKIIVGKITPPIAGVTIKVTRSDGQVFTYETDASGAYKLPTMDASFTYEVSASKESYYFTGPDVKGTFKASKLGEIIVTIFDEQKGTPLPGALVSLSGGESYRSNIQTNDTGMIHFTGLSPSEYFLRPMMKEYSFIPQHKILTVSEGATIKVKMNYKRIAFSAYGTVSSLSGLPEENVLVTATGLKDCAEHIEQATSETNGQFRIRGLKPNCGYKISIKEKTDTTPKIIKSLPNYIPIVIVNSDVYDLNLIVVHQVPIMDVIVHVTSPDPENFKNVQIKVCRENAPNSPIHSVKIDASLYKVEKIHNPGVVVHLPSLPLDNKLYFVRLDSISQGPQSYSTEPIFFNTNTTAKRFKIEYNPLKNSNDQHIAQTSVLALPFILLCMLSIYNIDKLSRFFIDFFNRYDMNNLTGIFQRFTALPTERQITENIDELVQNINAPKKKVKTRKT